MKKSVYFNLLFRLLFMFLIAYLYTIAWNFTSDLAIIFIMYFPCIGVLLLFVFLIIDYFSLKKVDASLRFVILTSFFCTLVFYCTIFVDSPNSITRILFATVSTFLPSLISYFFQWLVSSL